MKREIIDAEFQVVREADPVEPSPPSKPSRAEVIGEVIAVIVFMIAAKLWFVPWAWKALYG